MPTSDSSQATTRSSLPWILLLATLVLGGTGFYAIPKLSGGLRKQDLGNVLTHEVGTEDLLITVTEEGNVESANNVDVKCQVAGGSSILWIVADGKQVEKGEKIVELDSSALEEQINTQRIAFEKARATKIQSEKNFSVAKISVVEYLEGTFKQALQDAEALITVAEENLRSAKNSLVHSEKMFRKGYVSELDLEGAKFAVDRAKLELGSATTAREVLVMFTKEKTMEDLRSQRDNAEAQMRSDGSAFELEESRLTRLEAQLANCTILAPQNGMVVYANERGGRGGQTTATIEEGAAVRERQTLLRLPDLDEMQVKVNVHESKVDQIEAGMRARIRILDQELKGVVTSVANQPEPTSFFSSNVKEYATYVRVNDDDKQVGSLRPGMTAEVEILVAHLKSAITLPVAAVIEQRGAYTAWVNTSPPERRPLVLGLTNDEFVEVKDGVAVGDLVLLNPRAIVKEAREEAFEEKVDVSEKFGDAVARRPAAAGGDRTRGQGPRPGGAVPGGGRPSAGGGRPSGGRPGGGMSSLDKDGDGKISKDEAPGPMQARFGMMDTNGDGFVDQAEQEALRKKFSAGGGGPGAGARPNN